LIIIIKEVARMSEEAIKNERELIARLNRPIYKEPIRLDEIGREWSYATGHFETTQTQKIRILDHQRTGE
jgi:hypothetical protein